MIHVTLFHTSATISGIFFFSRRSFVSPTPHLTTPLRVSKQFESFWTARGVYFQPLLTLLDRHTRATRDIQIGETLLPLSSEPFTFLAESRSTDNAAHDYYRHNLR